MAESPDEMNFLREIGGYIGKLKARAASRKTLSYFVFYVCILILLILVMPWFISLFPSLKSDVVGNVAFYAMWKDGEDTFFVLTFVAVIALSYVAQKKKWVVIDDG